LEANTRNSSMIRALKSLGDVDIVLLGRHERRRRRRSDDGGRLLTIG
jgi:hypothetical protein